MQQRELKKYLEDILLSIDAIIKYTNDLQNEAAYTIDEETIDAVERRLAIIGEALFKANKLDAQLQISQKSKIIALRHILVHEYDLIDHATIWAIIKEHLPVLRNEIQAIRKE